MYFTFTDKGKRSQKAKEAPVAAAPTAATKQSAIPGSQPPKPTSKGNKMRELNRKGENKEGSDMDSISITAEAPIVENCNQPPQQPQPPPVVHQQSPPPQPQTQPQPQPPPPQPSPPPQTPPAQPKSPEPVPLAETPPPSKPEVKTIIKNKVDVTSIVKEVPKSKPFTAPVAVAAPVSNAVESQDETDRAVTEKLVQVKNEANIKANSADANDNNQVIDKNTIRYKKGKYLFVITGVSRQFQVC